MKILATPRDGDRLDVLNNPYCTKLGMEAEELERLADMRGSPEKAGKDSYGRGWVPDDH